MLACLFVCLFTCLLPVDGHPAADSQQNSRKTFGVIHFQYRTTLKNKYSLGESAPHSDRDNCFKLFTKQSFLFDRNFSLWNYYKISNSWAPHTMTKNEVFTGEKNLNYTNLWCRCLVCIIFMYHNDFCLNRLLVPCITVKGVHSEWGVL